MKYLSLLISISLCLVLGCKNKVTSTDIEKPEEVIPHIQYSGPEEILFVFYGEKDSELTHDEYNYPKFFYVDEERNIFIADSTVGGSMVKKYDQQSKFKGQYEWIPHPTIDGNFFGVWYERKNKIDTNIRVRKYDSKNNTIWEVHLEDGLTTERYFKDKIIVYYCNDRKICIVDIDGKLIGGKPIIFSSLTDKENSALNVGQFSPDAKKLFQDYRIFKNKKGVYKIQRYDRKIQKNVKYRNLPKKYEVKVFDVYTGAYEKTLKLDLDFVKYPEFEAVDVNGNLYFSNDKDEIRWWGTEIPSGIVIFDKYGRKIKEVTLAAKQVTVPDANAVCVDIYGNIYQMYQDEKWKGIHIIKWERVRQ